MQGLETVLGTNNLKKSTELSDFEIIRPEVENSSINPDDSSEKKEFLDEKPASIVDGNRKERQKQLVDFEDLAETESLRIVIDHRETKSGVARVLDKLGIELSFTALDIGDYVVSDRLAVERKRTDDFASSLIDGKRNLFAQLSEIGRAHV